MASHGKDHADTEVSYRSAFNDDPGGTKRYFQGLYDDIIKRKGYIEAANNFRTHLIETTQRVLNADQYAEPLVNKWLVMDQLDPGEFTASENSLPKYLGRLFTGRNDWTRVGNPAISKYHYCWLQALYLYLLLRKTDTDKDLELLNTIFGKINIERAREQSPNTGGKWDNNHQFWKQFVDKDYPQLVLQKADFEILKNELQGNDGDAASANDSDDDGGAEDNVPDNFDTSQGAGEAAQHQANESYLETIKFLEEEVFKALFLMESELNEDDKNNWSKFEKIETITSDDEFQNILRSMIKVAEKFAQTLVDFFTNFVPGKKTKDFDDRLKEARGTYENQYENMFNYLEFFRLAHNLIFTDFIIPLSITSGLSEDDVIVDPAGDPLLNNKPGSAGGVSGVIYNTLGLRNGNVPKEVIDNLKRSNSEGEYDPTAVFYSYSVDGKTRRVIHVIGPNPPDKSKLKKAYKAVFAAFNANCDGKEDNLRLAAISTGNYAGAIPFDILARMTAKALQEAFEESESLENLQIAISREKVKLYVEKSTTFLEKALLDVDSDDGDADNGPDNSETDETNSDGSDAGGGAGEADNGPDNSETDESEEEEEDEEEEDEEEEEEEEEEEDADSKTNSDGSDASQGAGEAVDANSPSVDVGGGGGEADAAVSSRITDDDNFLLMSAGYALVKEEGSVNAASGRAPSAPPAEPDSGTPVEVPAEFFSLTAECLLFNKGPVVFKMADEKSLQITFRDQKKHTFRAESYGFSADNSGTFKIVDTPVAVEFFRSVFVKDGARTDTGTALADLQSLRNIKFASARSVGMWWRNYQKTYTKDMEQYDLLYFYFEQCAGRGGKRPVGIPPPPGDLRNFRIIWKEVFKTRGVAQKKFT